MRVGNVNNKLPQQPGGMSQYQHDDTDAKQSSGDLIIPYACRNN